MKITNLLFLVIAIYPAISFGNFSVKEQQDMVNSHNKWRSSVKLHLSHGLRI